VSELEPFGEKLLHFSAGITGDKGFLVNIVIHKKCSFCLNESVRGISLPSD